MFGSSFRYISYYGDPLGDAIRSMAGLLIFLGIAAGVLQVISNCLIFKKAGRPWGFAFIPVYGSYVLYDIAESRGLFFGTIFISAISVLLGVLSGATGGSTFVAVILFILIIITGIMAIVMNVRLARVFGHGGGFAVGLLFLGPIFMLILGCSSNEYLGYKPQTTDCASVNYWFCSSCGAKNELLSNYCSKCNNSRNSH